MNNVPGSQTEPPTEDDDDDYYSSEIRLANRESIHALTAKPNPTDFTSLRNGLAKESTCWRVFTKEEDALQCAEKCSSFGMVPFMYCHRNSNRRYYLVTHPLELWHRNLNRPISHTYEIIHPNKPSKLHVQLQFDKSLNQHSDGSKMTDIFIKIFLYFLKSKYYLELDKKCVLILDGSDDKIFDRHLIFHLPPPLQFHSSKESSDCVIQTCNLIRSALYENSELCEVANIERRDLKMLQIRTANSRNYSLFVNEHLYSELHYVRVLGSTDLDHKPILQISSDNKYTVAVMSEPMKEECLFLASILTLRVLIPTGMKPDLKKKDVQVVHEKRENPAVKSPISPFPLLDLYMLNLLSPCTIGVVLSYQNDNCLVYGTKEGGFCHRIGTFHQRNRTMWVVLLDRGVLYQKCHDPDCKDFASKPKPIPLQIQQYLKVTDEWHQPIVDAFKRFSISDGTKKPKRRRLDDAPIDEN